MNLHEWQERKRPSRLEKRYEFESYDSLRAFLDDVADLSEAGGLYPDIGFGRNHANFTIHVDEGSTQLTDQQRLFAAMLDKLESARQA
jgi:4a-hydroxytetrahydrobiopterin dehydratase